MYRQIQHVLKLGYNYEEVSETNLRDRKNKIPAVVEELLVFTRDIDLTAGILFQGKFLCWFRC